MQGKNLIFQDKTKNIVCGISASGQLKDMGSKII